MKLFRVTNNTIGVFYHYSWLLRLSGLPIVSLRHHRPQLGLLSTILGVSRPKNM
jgi:hypothetical protein